MARGTVGRERDESLPMVHPLAAVLVADDEARFCEVNTAATALLKYSKPQLLSMHVWDITAPAQGGDARALWQEFINAGHQAGVYQVRRADGRRVTVHYEALANFRPGRHLSVIRPVSLAQAGSRPLDECPFERPFPEDFDRCPAYQPLLAYMADSSEHPVRPVWTCEHLTATRIPGEQRYYARCGLGDALNRSRWLAAANQHHWLDIRGLRIRFYREAEGQLRDLIAAKTADLSRARHEDQQRMVASVAGVVGAFDAFSQRNSLEFLAADLDTSLLRGCLQAALDDFQLQRHPGGLRPSSSLVAQYPLPVQAFFRPDLVS